MQHLCRILVGRGRTEVYGTVYQVGPDLLVVVGGTGLHIGAASLAEGARGGETAVGSVTGRGHKEAELTDKVAARLCAATGCRTLAVSGIHLDRITKGEIEEIRANVEELSRLLAARLGVAHGTED
jgi:hypothetical protein